MTYELEEHTPEPTAAAVEHIHDTLLNDLDYNTDQIEVYGDTTNDRGKLCIIVDEAENKTDLAIRILVRQLPNLDDTDLEWLKGEIREEQYRRKKV